jgi:hypothetical protein
MGIVSFQIGSKTFKFKEPLMFENEKAEGGLCLGHEGLSLSACGSSWSECDNIIRDQIAMLWQDYAFAQDDELTADGVTLKNKLLAMVEEVK